MKLKDLKEGQRFRFSDDTERLKLRGWNEATYSSIGEFVYDTVCEGTAPRLIQAESKDVRIFSASTFYRDVLLINDNHPVS
jgi:hypothetical protein